MKTENGLIIKAIGGFYYIEAADSVIECRARGRFRKGEVSPMAGDTVEIEYDEAEKTGVINRVFERKNFFVRPPVANLDIIVFVISVCDPSPSFGVIDKLTAIAEYKGIEPVIVITKEDISDGEQVAELYEKCGYTVFRINHSDLSRLDALKEMLGGKITAFIGNSGVGKSTLLNSIDGGLLLETGDISKKLGRGRHTTRQVTLYKLCGGYIADTPGFSTVDFEKYDIIAKEELENCFRDFKPYLGGCRFSDCAHLNEKGCEICEAVKSGKIAKSRHDCYVQMYDRAKNYKEWEHR